MRGIGKAEQGMAAELLAAQSCGSGKAGLGSGAAQACVRGGARVRTVVIVARACGDGGLGQWCGEAGELGAGDRGVGELRRARVRV